MFNPVNSLGNVSMMMNLIAQRQKTIGANIANVDTPGYIRHDISFGQYLNDMNSPLETALSQKLGPSPLISEEGEGPVNPVEELVALQENSMLYSVAARRMSNIITQMKTVINVGK